MRLIPCTIKGKPLVLPWGQTPRLDSGVRVLLDSGSGITLFLASSAFASFVVTFLSLVRISSGQEVFKLLSSIMNSITDIKCALTRKAFDAFCTKYHIPEEVHPVLPNQNDTMHERPAGKIGLYTRFFDYANFRLPLSSFLVDAYRHFRINISQLSVIGAAKVSHFEILCRVYGNIPTVGLFRCFYVNSKKNGWMSFSKRSDNAPTWISLLSYIPQITTVNMLSLWERNEDVPLLLQGHYVDKLFDEGGSGNQTEQGGSAGSGRGADIQLVSEATDTVAEDVAPLQPRRQRKRKTLVVGAVQRLLAGAVLNADVRGEAIPTLPFVTSSTLLTILVLMLRRLKLILLSGLLFQVMTVVTTVTSTVDPALVVKEKPVKPSLFSTDFFSVWVPSRAWTNRVPLDNGRVCCEMVDEFAHPKFFASVCGMENDQLFTEFNVGAARQISLSAKVRMRAEYNVKEKQREAKVAKAIRLRAEASKFETMEKSFQDEVIALKEHNTMAVVELPVAYRAQFPRGDHGQDPFILLEAIASQDLWI
ncbi:hypothetical protein Tco_0216280 [Tanacetum coccineum]